MSIFGTMMSIAQDASNAAKCLFSSHSPKPVGKCSAPAPKPEPAPKPPQSTPAATEAAKPKIKVSEKQLQKKFKHANDFGVKGNYSPANAAKFQAAIENHVADPSTKVINGTYHGQPVTHYVNPQTGLNVVKEASGQFQSGWELSPAQMKHVITTGKL